MHPYSFKELKNRLCSAPVLTLPDLQQPFEIEIDASDYAIGAVLNDSVFMVVNRLSMMAIMVACKKNITAEATATLFFEQVWVHFGIPQSIISDQDSRFLSTFWSSLWSMLDTKLTKSIAFHPQIDGQTEVVNKMIVHILCM